MSAPIDAPASDIPSPERPQPRRDLRPAVIASAIDALVVAVWFAVAGLVGAVVWWQVTTLPQVTKSGDNATLAPEELLRQVSIDGWFFVVAAIGGLLSGVILLAWRRRDPLVLVVLVALGGALASWLMVRIGLSLGPATELSALRALDDGDRVSMQLKLHAPGMAWIWSIFAVLGSVSYLWVLRRSDADQPGVDNLS